jgi:hypothetical protein
VSIFNNPTLGYCWSAQVPANLIATPGTASIVLNYSPTSNGSLLSNALTFTIAQVVNLPTGDTTPTISFATDQSLPSFALVQFTDLPVGYDVMNQTYLGWSAAFNNPLYVSPISPGSPIWSENDAVYRLSNTYPAGAGSAWPMVNWLLNNKQGEWNR